MQFRNLYSTILDLYSTRCPDKVTEFKQYTDVLLDSIKGYPIIYKKFTLCRNLVNDGIFTKDELYYFMQDINEVKSGLYTLILEYTTTDIESRDTYLARISFTSTPEVLLMYYLDKEHILPITGTRLREVLKC